MQSNINEKHTDINRLFSDITCSEYFKTVRGDGVIYATASILEITLILLTDLDLGQIFKRMRFTGGELYFRTENIIIDPKNPKKDIIYKISMHDFQGKKMLTMSANYDQFDKYFFKKSEIRNLSLMIGQKFDYGDFQTERITEIILVTENVLSWQDVIDLSLKESKISREFDKFITI
jgi:hypothetical protein